jgi:hypothetical protein
MTRQVIMVFFGEARWHDAHEEHGAHGDFDAAREPEGDAGARWWCSPVCPSSAAHAAAVLGPDEMQHLEKWLEPVVERR